MKIMNLTDLKSNKIFKLLHKKQSEYDATDDKICNDTFTRSPLHLIQFLIVYAGLDDAQRQLVVNKLQICVLVVSVRNIFNHNSSSQIHLIINFEF